MQKRCKAANAGNYKFLFIKNLSLAQSFFFFFASFKSGMATSEMVQACDTEWTKNQNPDDSPGSERTNER